MKAKLKIALMKLTGLSLSIIPIGIMLGINWEQYTATTPETVKLIGGGLVGLSFAVITVLGKVKMKGWIWLGIIFGLAWSLKSIIDDILLFSGIAFGGSILDYIFIQGKVADMEETRVMDKQADISAKATAKAMTTVMTEQAKLSGRV